MPLEIELLKQKKKKENSIPISTTKDVICCSNDYVYHFLDYIKLLLFVNVSVIHHV